MTGRRTGVARASSAQAGLRALRLQILAAVLCLATSDAVRAAETAGTAGRVPDLPGVMPFMPLESIRPGMQGTARTVFEGDRLEEFGVEILGVLKNAIGPQQDLILARLHGPKVEFTGVVAGMSGSPVYIDGKLVGAVSYRIGAFAKEAIAGITPIGDMVKLAGPTTQSESGGTGAGSDLLGRFLEGTGWADEPATAPGRAHRSSDNTYGRWASAGVAGGLRPIGTPLVCSGCDAAVLRYYAPIFEAHGLEPTTGGGGASEGGPPRPLEPGTGIGGALVSGDLSLTGIGTLTHVDGNRVFAFGHPLLGTGPMQMPMTQAEILLTFPSSDASFKIANATRPVGTILRDGLTAIMGEVGRVTPTVPLTVRVASPAGRRLFHYELLRHRAWTPVMVAVTTANSLVKSIEFDASATLALRYRIDIEGFPPLETEDLYSGTNPAQPVHLALANEAGGLFGLIYGNPFEEPHVRGVDLDVEVLRESQVATISSLRATEAEVRPGEPFKVTAILSPFRGEDRQVTWEVTLPEDTGPGETQIIVGGGPAIDGLDRRVIERQLAQSSGLGDLLRLVGRQRKSRGLYLRVTKRSPSAIIRSEILPELPLSIFSVFNSPRLSADTTLMIEAPIMEIGKDLDLIAVGARRISVKVK